MLGALQAVVAQPRGDKPLVRPLEPVQPAITLCLPCGSQHKATVV
jgi:hypothetical protein